MSVEKLSRAESESGENNIERVEQRRKNWARFGSFALGASLLASGGIGGAYAEKAFVDQDKNRTETLAHDLQVTSPDKKMTFTIRDEETGHTSDFAIYKAPSGREYVVESHVHRERGDGPEDTNFKFVIPDNETTAAQVEAIENSKDVTPALYKLYADASSGEVNYTVGGDGSVHKFEFGNTKDGKAFAIESREDRKTGKPNGKPFKASFDEMERDTMPSR